MVEIMVSGRSNIKRRLNSLSRWTMPASVREEVSRFIEELALGKVNAGRRISERRQAKYLDLLKLESETFSPRRERFTRSVCRWLEPPGELVRSIFP